MTAGVVVGLTSNALMLILVLGVVHRKEMLKLFLIKKAEEEHFH